MPREPRCAGLSGSHFRAGACQQRYDLLPPSTASSVPMAWRSRTRGATTGRPRPGVRSAAHASRASRQSARSALANSPAEALRISSKAWAVRSIMGQPGSASPSCRRPGTGVSMRRFGLALGESQGSISPTTRGPGPGSAVSKPWRRSRKPAAWSTFPPRGPAGSAALAIERLVATPHGARRFACRGTRPRLSAPDPF